MKVCVSNYSHIQNTNYEKLAHARHLPWDWVGYWEFTFSFPLRHCLKLCGDLHNQLGQRP